MVKFVDEQLFDLILFDTVELIVDVINIPVCLVDIICQVKIAPIAKPTIMYGIDLVCFDVESI